MPRVCRGTTKDKQKRQTRPDEDNKLRKKNQVKMKTNSGSVSIEQKRTFTLHFLTSLQFSTSNGYCEDSQEKKKCKALC